MTITQTITTLPDVPDPATDTPEEFSDKAAAFVLGQKNMSVELGTFVPQVNSTMVDMNNAAAATAASQAAAALSQTSAAASAASAIASPSTNGTSTATITLGAGTVSLTTQTGKNWAPGMWINLARTSDPTKSQSGPLISYNSGTGALQMQVVAANVAGSGTFTDWTLTVSGQPGSIFNLVDLTLLGPSIRPSLLCDFANAKRLDSRFVYGMTSPLTYFDAAGVLRTASAGVPAFDHDPATGRCLGLSMWEARTNLALRSEEFDNASWGKSNATITVNAVTAPDGMVAMDKLVENTSANVSHIASQGRTASNETTSFSVFAKAGERTKVMLEMSNNVSYAVNAVFDLSNGTVVSTSAANADYSNISANIKSVGNGIYRCTFTCSKGAVNNTNSAGILLVNAAGNVVYTGDGTSGLYIWGAQLEVGSFSTPYIPTTSAAVTRNAPTLTMATSAFDFNAQEGTLYADSAQVSTGNSSAQYCAVELGDGTNNNLIHLATQFGSTNFEGLVNAGGVGQAGFFGAAVTSQTRRALAYAANDFAQSIAGGSVSTDTSGSVPTGITALAVGCRATGSGQLNGWISKVAYYPKRLTNNELVAMSTL